MSRPDLINEFCNYLLTQKRYSGHTVSGYRNDLSGFREYLFNEYEIDDLAQANTQLLKSWLSSLREQELETRSINRKLSATKSFYKYLLRREIVSSNPASAISSMKTKKMLPVFVEEKQLQPVLDRDFFPKGFDGDTRFLIFLIFYHTGMRVSELAQLRNSDVHSSAGIITVFGKGNKQRNVPIDTGLLKRIEHYISLKKQLFENPSDTLIVNDKNQPLSRTTLYRIVKLTLSEVTTISKKSPHVLRHSFATHLSNHGAPIGAIKELLGHSSLVATQVYTHTSIARLKEIYKKAHPKS